MTIPKFLFTISTISLFISSCNSTQDANNQYNTNRSKSYHINLSPIAGSKYKFTVDKKTNIKLRVNDEKKINSIRLKVTFSLTFSKDTIGNYALALKYDRIHLDTKTDDKETEIDSDDSPNPFNLEENIFHVLKTATITAVIDSERHVKDVNGYQNIESSIMSSTNISDNNTQRTVKNRLDQLIKVDLIQANLSGLFKFSLPDTLHIGDQWTDSSAHANDLDLNLVSNYTLESVSDETAFIQSSGLVSGDHANVYLMGTEVSTNIHGEQKAKYHLNIQTGMLESGDINVDLNGTISVLEKQIPVQITITTHIIGKTQS